MNEFLNGHHNFFQYLFAAGARLLTPAKPSHNPVRDYSCNKNSALKSCSTNSGIIQWTLPDETPCRRGIPKWPPQLNKIEKSYWGIRVSVNEFLNDHHNRNDPDQQRKSYCFSERIPKWPPQLYWLILKPFVLSFSERIPKWPPQRIPNHQFTANKVSVNEFLNGHHNVYPTINSQPIKFQWTNS